MCMKRRSFLRSSAAFVGISMFASGDTHADQIHPQHVHAAFERPKEQCVRFSSRYTVALRR
jgi:hypothetical protein